MFRSVHKSLQQSFSACSIHCTPLVAYANAKWAYNLLIERLSKGFDILCTAAVSNKNFIGILSVLKTTAQFQSLREALALACTLPICLEMVAVYECKLVNNSPKQTQPRGEKKSFEALRCLWAVFYFRILFILHGTCLEIGSMPCGQALVCYASAWLSWWICCLHAFLCVCLWSRSLFMKLQAK